jgi:hypothetical protein
MDSLLTEYGLHRHVLIQHVSAGDRLSFEYCAYAGHKQVKVVKHPWNAELEPADVTLVVGRNALGPVESGVEERGEFFLKLHPQSANPACLDNVVTTISRQRLLASSPPVFFNSGDIFTFRKCFGSRSISFYEKREYCQISIAWIFGDCECERTM